MSENNTPKVWVSCPICSQRLFRHDPPKRFNIEAVCNRCKAIHRIYSEGAGVNFETVRQPRYGWKPLETKDG